MQALLTIYALAAILVPQSGYTESVKVYTCDVDHYDAHPELEADINYDGWPDRWPHG